jgi:hypothetical protein
MRKVVAALAFATGLALFSSPAHGQPARSASPEGTTSQAAVRQDPSIVAAEGATTDAAASRREVLGKTRSQLLATTGDLAFTTSHLAPGLIAGVGLILAGGLLLLAVRRRCSTA